MLTPLPVVTTRRPSWRLILLTAVVLLAHWAVLSAAPVAFAAHASSDAGSDWAFSTRTIASTPEAPAATPDKAKEPATAVPTRKVRSVRSAPQVQVISTEGIQQNDTPALVESAQPAIETVAIDTPFAETPTPSAAAVSPAVQLAEAAASMANQTPATLPAAKAVQRFVVPPSARLKYAVQGEVKGFPYHANGDLQWAQDGKTYSARLEISHFLLGSRVQTSTGQVGDHGLEPIRFGDKVRSEVAAHFNYETKKVTFSANTPNVDLLPGAQDQLSVLVQAATMVAGDPQLFVQGSTLSFQAVGPKSAESWVFTVGATEKLDLPGGEMSALRLWRDPNAQYDSKLEIWLAPSLGYLPVRIRLTQANGDLVDQLWKSTQQ
ncbi:MAG: DUF3108 domain-containing protein [Rhodoferax sp.]